MPETTHEGNDPMGALTTHRGPLDTCPAPDCQDRLIEQQEDDTEWGLVVDEVVLNSIGKPASAWWAEQSGNFYRNGKLRYLAAVPVGAIAEVGPFGKEEAEFARSYMVSQGVHSGALKVRRWTQQPHLPTCRKAKPCRLCKSIPSSMDPAARTGVPAGGAA